MIEDGTKKTGLGRAKTHVISLKKGATKRVSQPKLKKNKKKTAHLHRFLFRKQSTRGGFLCRISLYLLHTEKHGWEQQGAQVRDFGISGSSVSPCWCVWR